MAKKSRQKLIIDADIIIHFHKAGKLLDLKNIYTQYDKVILDIVQNELSIKREFKPVVDNLINWKVVESIPIKGDLKIYMEFAKLKKKFGDGESACMAYCKFNEDVLASSNLRDIKDYCEEHSIQYLTTMDFIMEAYHSGVFNKAECDLFIYDVKSKGSKLPVNTIQEYIDKYQNV